jgi:hypothetical protein
MITRVDTQITVDVAAAQQRLRQVGVLEQGIKLQFMTQADDRVRAEHAVLHGTVWDAGDPQRPVPPLDYGCRCYLRHVTTDKSTAEKQGVELVRNPPKTATESIALLKEDAAERGFDLTNQSIFGKAIGNAIDAGDVTIQQLVGQGMSMGSFEVQLLASGIKRSLIVSTMTALSGYGLSARMVRSVITRAKTLEGTTYERIRSALDEIAPATLTGRTQRQTDARRDHVARLIERIARGIL